MTQKILIVEDSEAIRNSLVALMQAIPGIESVRTASTMAHAVACIRQYQPSLAVLDLQLPDGVGTELIRPLRAKVPSVRIAILTNFASDFSRKRCLCAGADWFFDKSTEFDSLLQMLREHESVH